MVDLKKYDTFKLFRTEYKFKSKREKEEYFNNILKDSTSIFKSESRRFEKEKFNIIWSWSILFKILSFIIIFSTLLFPLVFSVILIGIGILFRLTGVILKKTLVNKISNYEFSEAFLTDDLLESIR